MLVLNLFTKYGERERELVLGVRRGRGHGVVYIGERDSTMKEIVSHDCLTIRYRSQTAWGRDGRRSGASGARGGAARTWVRPHPQWLPLA